MAVMSTAMDNAGHDCSVLTEAESLIMAKEHLIDEYGTLRYTIGTGCSGGSLAQQQVANAYPGVYQGILPAVLVPGLLVHRTAADATTSSRATTSRTRRSGAPGSLWTPAQIAAVQGHPNYANSVELSTLYWPTLADPAYACAGVTAAQRWSPTNPSGTRCDLEDYMINLFGPLQGRQPVRLRRHPARQRRRAVRTERRSSRGSSPPSSSSTSTRRSAATTTTTTRPRRGWSRDEPALTNDYRGGAVNETNNLNDVAIIDLRGPDAGTFHDAYRSWAIRARLEQVEGHFPKNDVIWFGETPLIGDPNYAAKGSWRWTSWLSAVEADHRSASLQQKVADDRPSDVHDQCSDIPNVEQVVVPGVGEVCQSAIVQTRFATPRMEAGESINTDQEKCRLKPLRRPTTTRSRSQTRSGPQLQQMFPSGVCDWSKPGVDQAPTIPWQTYQTADRERHLRRQAARAGAGGLRWRVDESVLCGVGEPVGPGSQEAIDDLIDGRHGRHLGGDPAGRSAIVGRGEDRFDRVAQRCDVLRSEAAQTPRRLLIGGDHDPSPRALDGLAVVWLVGKHGADDQRHARRERPECGARAAMADDDRGPREDGLLRNPLLNARVVGHRPEASHVGRAAYCHQHPRREPRDCLQSTAVDRDRLREMADHCAEGHVYERSIRA